MQEAILNLMSELKDKDEFGDFDLFKCLMYGMQY